jgi:hypothetical protein
MFHFDLIFCGIELFSLLAAIESTRAIYAGTSVLFDHVQHGSLFS